MIQLIFIDVKALPAYPASGSQYSSEVCPVPLSPEDQAAFEALKKQGVLCKIDNDRLPPNIIVVMCGDGDHVTDQYGYQEQLCRWKEASPRVHLIALNGGALLIPETCPLPEDSAVMRRHIAKAMALKRIRDAVLYVHAPCGMAREFGLSFEGVIAWLMAAKARLEIELPDVGRIFPFCHVHKPCGKKSTYFVSRDAWLKRAGQPLAGAQAQFGMR